MDKSRWIGVDMDKNGAGDNDSEIVGIISRVPNDIQPQL